MQISFPFLAFTTQVFFSMKEPVWPSSPIFSYDEKWKDKVTAGDSWIPYLIRILLLLPGELSTEGIISNNFSSFG